MNFQEYQKVQSGKHSPTVIYLHKSTIDSLPIIPQKFLKQSIKKLGLF